MAASGTPPADTYDLLYREFDSPLMRQIRREAYGDDIGQHSWVSADEVRADIARLRVDSSSRLVDLGCGPGGPLTFLVSLVRCSAVGVELSEAALQAARSRAQTLAVSDLIAFEQVDLNAALPFAAASFDVAISLDVILHVRDRAHFLGEVARILRPGGRLLYTDAGVLASAISNEEVRRRSAHGDTHFVPPGANERLIAAAGLKLIETENRTASTFKNAAGRLAALRAHRAEVEHVIGADGLAQQFTYLETVVDLARRAALSRIMYLAQEPHS